MPFRFYLPVGGAFLPPLLNIQNDITKLTSYDETNFWEEVGCPVPYPNTLLILSRNSLQQNGHVAIVSYR